MPLRGVKGTTGTQASFLELFDGDHGKVRELERRVTAAMGFSEVVPVTGQTYSRKIDAQVLGVVAGVAASAAKFSGDVRMLQAFGEVEEPFEKEQVGSSAMAYKRNPVRAERMCGLARRLITDSLNGPLNAATQAPRKALDDSVNRILAIAAVHEVLTERRDDDVEPPLLPAGGCATPPPRVPPAAARRTPARSASAARRGGRRSRGPAAAGRCRAGSG